MYTDTDFTATKRSLGGDFGVARWARLSELYDHPVVGSPDPHDIVQGVLGDCYLLSALCALAADERRVRELFDERSRSKGQYTVFFYEKGRRVGVTIDDYVPVDALGIPVFARGLTGLWVALVEKAYAKLHGSYAKITGGHEIVAMHELSGGVPLVYPLSPEGIAVLGVSALDAMWSRLDSLLREGSLVAVSHDRAHAVQGIFGLHSYAVIGTLTVRARGSSTRLALLRNPYGRRDGWTGRWSAVDPLWSQVAETPTRGGFYMSIADLVQVFTTMSICRLPGPGWCAHRVDLSPHDLVTVSCGGDARVCIAVSLKCPGPASITIATPRETRDDAFTLRTHGIEMKVAGHDFPLSITSSKECSLKVWTSTKSEVSERVTVRF